MKRLLLTTDTGRAAHSDGYDEVFVWNSASEVTSFATNLTAGLAPIGVVRVLNADLVRIAVAVYAADRSVLRQGQGSDWNQRILEVTVPVADAETWRSSADPLAAITGFLTGDKWSFVFEQTAFEPNQGTLIDAALERCVLLSGGADSATGALLSQSTLAATQRHELVSHFSQNALSPIQQELVARLGNLFPDPGIEHRQIHLARRRHRTDGTAFQDETSSRSRSFLFLALGLAAASITGAPLWVPENGFASLNPPLGPERRGSLTTKTTHPRFISDLRNLLSGIGAHGEVINPFSDMTKGEMFRWVADTIGHEAASEYLSSTNSCSHTTSRFIGGTSGSSCGVCFGCTVRRSSFRAAGIDDRTQYLSSDTSGQYDVFIAEKSVVIAMRDFTSTGVNTPMVYAMNLPPEYSARSAHDLCRRGIDELQDYLQ